MEFSVTGYWFSYFSAVFSSSSKLHSDEVIYTTDGSFVVVVVFVLHWAPKELQPELSEHENKVRGI